MNVGHEFKNLVVPRDIYRLFEKKKVEDQTGISEFIISKKQIHPVIFREYLRSEVFSMKKNYKDITVPSLLQNVTFNNKERPGMVTSISTFRNLLGVANTKGCVGIYNLGDMMKFRNLNNGRGPELKFPLGYVLTEKERKRVRRGRNFRLEPVQYNEAGENGCHRGVISGISFSPQDGQLYVTSGWDGNLKIWDTFENDCVLTLGCQSKVYLSGICQNNPNLVGVALHNGGLRVLDMRIGDFSQTLFLDQKITNLRTDNAMSPILSFSWREDSEHILASGSQNGFIRLWDLRFAPQPFLYMNHNSTDWGFVQETNHLTPLLLQQQVSREKSLFLEREEMQKSAEDQGTQKREELNIEEARFLGNYGQMTTNDRSSRSFKARRIGEAPEEFEDQRPGLRQRGSFGINVPETLGYAHEGGISDFFGPRWFYQALERLEWRKLLCFLRCLRVPGTLE
ncbi:WD domain, G-beta repeat-containing protein [Cryptosporidium felis]|nr:WD domain, G-beta repeat-containing protein [Cryptosporidium felis]